MKVSDLIQVLSALNPDHCVYMQMQDETSEQKQDPTLLQDINEVVIDTEDYVVVIRAVERG